MILDAAVLQKSLSAVRAIEIKEPEIFRCEDLADKYDLLRLEKDDMKRMPLADMRAVLDYASEYVRMCDAEVSSRILYRPANGMSFRYRAVEGKWMLCNTGNILVTPQVPMADMDEIEAYLKIKEVIKMVTSEIGRK